MEDPQDEGSSEEVLPGIGQDKIGGLDTSPIPTETPSGRPMFGDDWSEGPLPRQNRLLASLPEESFQRLAPKLEPMAFGLKQILWDRNETITHVYFPLN